VTVQEIGLFPLGIVLLPTERIPLHIFEPRYRELIHECLEHELSFGLLFADEGGVRELGTLARVDEVVERFEDGRMNVIVRGVERFRVERLTEGRSFLTASIGPVADDDEEEPDAALAERAIEAFRALAAAAEAEPRDLDEESAYLSFELAAQVELAAEAKQRLLELRSERERLELVAELFDGARAGLLAMRELSERAKKNGSRL